MTFFDNAVSTGPESTLSALEALRLDGPIRWVAGGRSKGGSLAPYVDDLAAQAASIHLFGEIANELGTALEAKGHDVRRHGTVRSALDDAFASARTGDQLLFSPAFSSFDQYPNFEARARDALAWWHAMRCDELRSDGIGGTQAGTS